MHVLFCEKGIIYRNLLGEELRKQGYEVAAVSGGQDALDRLDEDQGRFRYS